MKTKRVWFGLIMACLGMAPIGCGMALDGGVEENSEEVGADLGADDEEMPLGTAEMALTSANYSTYLGGSGDEFASSVAVDASGNTYVAGVTNPNGDGNIQIFVKKLSATGTLLYYVTFGGAGEETADGIAVDSTGNVYVVGTTTSYTASRDVLVAKLNATASAFVYYAYFGGSDTELSRGIAIDSAGSAYVTGRTQSTNFPVAAGMPQTILRGNADAFVTKLNAAGNGIVYSTYLGGTDYDEASGIAVDAYGYAYVTGTTASTNFPTTAGAFRTFSGGKQDVFVTELIPSGASFYYSTYLGGSDADFGQEIAVDGAYNAYVTGFSYSTNFPTTAGVFRTSNAGGQDAFVAKLNEPGNGLLYATYVGGSANDAANSIVVSSTGKAVLTGVTGSMDFPTTPGAFRTTNGGAEDAFVAELSATGSALSYSTYAGGSQVDMATDIVVSGTGNVQVVGNTSSTNFPALSASQPVHGGGLYDTFVLKFSGP